MGDNSMFESWIVGVICLARVLVAALGGFGNIITIHTFIRIGCSDTVNMSLTWLAVSNLLYLFSVLINSTALIFKSAEEITVYKLWFPIEPEAVYTVFVNVGGGAYANTMLVTTFITVLRCLGVVKPLHFRNLLSWKKTAVILSLFSSFSVLTVILLLAYLGIIPQFDPLLNTTRPTLWFSPRRKFIKDVIFALRDAVLPFAFQIIVSVCVILLASALRRSSKFRIRHTMTVHVQNKLSNIMRDPQQNTNSGTNDSTPAACRGYFDRKDDTSSKLGGKELQAVRQMLIIASFYTVCNIPKVAANLAEVSVPGFSLGQRYQIAYNTVHGIRELFQTVNAAVGFLIYLRFNSVFKRRCILPSVCRLLCSPNSTKKVS